MSPLPESVRSLLFGGKLHRKLILAFVSIAILTALVGVIGFLGVSETSATSESIANEGTETVDGVMMLKLESQRERAATLAYIRGDTDAREEFNGATEKFDRVYEQRLDSREDLPPEMRTEMREAKQLHEDAVAHAQAAMDAKQAGDQETMQAELEAYETTLDELGESLEELEGMAKDELQSEVAAAQQTQRTGAVLISILTLGAFGAALMIGRQVGGGIASEVGYVRDTAERIADGEFDFEVRSSDRGDEIGDLVRSFERMTSYLATVSRQATAVANQDFDAEVLDEEVPGTLGEVMTQMATDIEQAQRETEQARRNVESLNQSLREKATDYQTTMEKAADGDLAQRMNPESESDAMRQIGESFNEMMTEIERMVATVQEFTDDVDESGQHLLTDATDIRSASEEASNSVQDIADSADEQHENLKRVNDELQGLSGSIEEIASSADEVASTAQVATDRGQSGREAASAAIEEMEAIQETADRTVSEVEGLATEIAEISEIVELINEIAEQTNMLALNASIEAARAGEAGEGFAVVADEIKGLATEVRSATDDIESLIEDIQASTTDTAEDMQQLGQRVEAGTDTIEDALIDLEEIVDMVEDVNSGIQEISDATDDQAMSTTEAVELVDEVTELAEQANIEAEAASTATEQQTSAVQDVSDQLHSLSAQTEGLSAFLETYDVDDETETIDHDSSAGVRVAHSDGGRETDRSD